jgi:hypothetical protein
MRDNIAPDETSERSFALKITNDIYVNISKDNDFYV